MYGLKKSKKKKLTFTDYVALSLERLMPRKRKHHLLTDISKF